MSVVLILTFLFHDKLECSMRSLSLFQQLIVQILANLKYSSYLSFTLFYQKSYLYDTNKSASYTIQRLSHSNFHFFLPSCHFFCVYCYHHYFIPCENEITMSYIIFYYVLEVFNEIFLIYTAFLAFFSNVYFIASNVQFIAFPQI